MGSRNHPPPARLQSRGGKAAPVTSLSDPSPTRPTPVKLEPRPLPAALPSLPNPDSCQPPPGAPRRWGTGRVPTPAGTRPPAETRPRLDAAAPADAPSGRPSCAPPARGGSARSPGQRQVLGAAVLLGVLLRRGRRGRRGRRRGLRGGGGGCCSTGGFGRHDALAGQAPADAGGGPGREDARTSGTPRPLPTPVTKII